MKAPYVIADDYLDTKYALSRDQVLAMKEAGHLTAYQSDGLVWRDYADDIPDYAVGWYDGAGWYADSGTVYQALKPERIDTMYAKAHNVRCVGFRGGRWHEWRCEVEVNGRMVDFYARIRQSGTVPCLWTIKATHEKFSF